MSEIISADCHLDFWYLPGDLFYSEAPAAWKERMPRVENTDSGRAWVHNPHPDGTWPDSQRFLDQELACLSDRVRRKVTHDNAAKLYGLQ